VATFLTHTVYARFKSENPEIIVPFYAANNNCTPSCSCYFIL